MNEFNINTRTLIVSFVVAIMALIPLRFVEAGQMVNSDTQVLGVKTEEAVVPEVQPVLEAPYNEIENQSCLNSDEAQQKLSELNSYINGRELDQATTDWLSSQFEEVNSNLCK